MNTKQIRINIKKGVIKSIKEMKYSHLIALTIIMSLTVSEDIVNAIPKSFLLQSTQDVLLKYLDYANIVRRIFANSFIRWILFSVTILFWIIKWYVHNCYSERPIKVIHVLGHSTLGKSQFKLNEEAMESSNLKIEELDLVEDIKIIENDFGALKYAINKQDNFIKNFRYKINNNDEYAYMGVAHTPLILRAGYHIGDETKFTIFHKKRNYNYYEELNNSELFTPIRIDKEDIKDNHKELIVAISTTFHIQDNQLSIFHSENKNIIKFKTDELGFDVITSKKQVEEYIGFILKEIRKVVTREDIIKIHMVISSSVAFTFAIGQALSSNYDREVIAYHFDINNPKIYPWGISLFKDANNCIVRN